MRYYRRAIGVFPRKAMRGENLKHGVLLENNSKPVTRVVQVVSPFPLSALIVFPVSLANIAASNIR